MLDVKKAPTYAIHNSHAITNEKLCGCYYCVKIYETKEIKEWTDNSDTALCPYCQRDSVIPAADGFLSIEELQKVKEYWVDKLSNNTCSPKK